MDTQTTPNTTQKAQVTIMANHMIKQLQALAAHEFISPLNHVEGLHADLNTITQLLKGEIG